MQCRVGLVLLQQIKIAYINALLRVGFDTIDFGSFVSGKQFRKMADTKTYYLKIYRKTANQNYLPSWQIHVQRMP